MTRGNPTGPLIFIPEIEAHVRNLNAEKKKLLLEDIASSLQRLEGQGEPSLVRNPVFEEGDAAELSDTEKQSIMANEVEDPQALRDYLFPRVDEDRSPVVYNDVPANQFELKSSMIQWVQTCCMFHGLY